MNKVQKPPQGYVFEAISGSHYLARDHQRDLWAIGPHGEPPTVKHLCFPEGGYFTGAIRNIGWGKVTSDSSSAPFFVDLNKEFDPRALEIQFTDFGSDITAGSASGEEVWLQMDGTAGTRLVCTSDRSGFLVRSGMSEESSVAGLIEGFVAVPDGFHVLSANIDNSASNRPILFKIDRVGKFIGEPQALDGSPLSGPIGFAGLAYFGADAISVIARKISEGDDRVLIWRNGKLLGAVRSGAKEYRQRFSDSAKLLANGLLILNEARSVVLPGVPHAIPAALLKTDVNTDRLGQLIGGAVTDNNETLLAFERGVTKVTL